MTETLHAFVLFAIASTASPGGATTLATASGVRFGWRRSLPLLFGIAVGLSVLTGAASGLSAILQNHPLLSLLMKIAGSAYLLWLAYGIGRAGAPQAGDGGRDAPYTFFAGIVLLVWNPKAWAMGFGAAASFAALASDPATLALIMGATFGVSAITFLSLWCAAGAALAKLLQTERQWRVLNVAMALLLAATIPPIWFT
ncbi:MAG: LysE family translocator [Alphaproteobacteria bacterium]|nr:LysE family translocator [Alphaproteobacteria bacterium]